jgi:hypothetical protein
MIRGRLNRFALSVSGADAAYSIARHQTKPRRPNIVESRSYFFPAIVIVCGDELPTLTDRHTPHSIRIGDDSLIFPKVTVTASPDPHFPRSTDLLCCSTIELANHIGRDTIARAVTTRCSRERAKKKSYCFIFV